MVDENGNPSQEYEDVNADYPVSWKNPAHDPNASPADLEEPSEKAKLFGALFAGVLQDVEEDLNGEVEKSKKFMEQLFPDAKKGLCPSHRTKRQDAGENVEDKPDAPPKNPHPVNPITGTGFLCPQHLKFPEIPEDSPKNAQQQLKFLKFPELPVDSPSGSKVPDMPRGDDIEGLVKSFNSGFAGVGLSNFKFPEIPKE